MKYNHAEAEAKFRKEWTAKLREYKAHGMTMAQILEIYKFDRAVFNSDRKYYKQCEALQYNDKDREYFTITEFDTYNIDNWIDVLPDKLRSQLSKLPEIHLKAFYLYRVCGYTQDEISVILCKPQRTISYWIGKIAEIIKEFSKSC